MCVVLKSKDELASWFKALSDANKLICYNSFQEASSGTFLYDMSYVELSEVLDLAYETKEDVFKGTSTGRAKAGDRYMWIDGYGHLRSANELSQTPFNDGDVIDWLNRDPHQVEFIPFNFDVVYDEEDDDE